MGSGRPSHSRSFHGRAAGRCGRDRGRCHLARRPDPRRPRQCDAPSAAPRRPPGRRAAAAFVWRLPVSVAAGPGASPRVRRAVLFTGIALSTCLVTLAYMDGARPAVPGMPHWLGIAAGAVLAWLAGAALVPASAGLLRGHYKALAVHTARHGKRGTIAAARMAGKGGRSAGSRLASWAGPRWAARRPADSAWLRPGEKRCRGCRGTGRGKDGTLTCPACRGFGSAPPDPDAPEAASGTVCTACGRPASPDDPVLADGGGPVHRSHAREQQASYDAALSGNPQQGDDVDVRAEVWRLRREAEVANLRGDKAAAGELETR